MHHHHPLNGAVSAHAHQRRRKKRPNYGTRTVEVRRGYNGFGFTISGQQPCRLSCIISNSPADQAGLRAGDFLISVNGLNVSKLPHETVVEIVGNSFGSIRMQIAENYFSDSSDEENAALMLQQQQQQQKQQQLQQQLSNATTSIGILNGQLCLTPSAGSGGGVGAASPGCVGVRTKPRYMHHKTKIHRMRNSPQKKRPQQTQQQQQQRATNFMHSAGRDGTAVEVQSLRPLIEDLPLNLQHNRSATIATTSRLNNNTYNSHLSHISKTTAPAAAAVSCSSSDVANVSAIVRVPTAVLEYRAIVGYLGTIEMPKQISHSSKLQTVRSCIRKLRQEKRQPTTVLMTILPDCLRLQASNGSLLASYASARLNYVSSSSESENRFFGLVTSAVHTSQLDEEEEDEEEEEEMQPQNHANNGDDGGGVGLNAKAEQQPHACSSSITGHISISNSCHVFVVDTKICEHQAHIARATEFRIECTNDPISSLCLEFPNNSEYVVNLIRSMYTMRILPPATRHHAVEDFLNGAHAAVAGGGGGGAGAAAAHSPQPSNHSEISTTTSNSDSGIGFHNDCTNISDRILVVDFPGAPGIRMRPNLTRPIGIFNNFDAIAAAADKRLTVRAMPDPKTTTASDAASAISNAHRPNLLANFQLIKSPASNLNATRSCDDVLALVERTPISEAGQYLLQAHASMDDISLHSTTTSTTTDTHPHKQPSPFLHPSCLETTVHRKHDNDTYSLLQNYCSGIQRRHTRYSMQLPKVVPNKLSPQVFRMDVSSSSDQTNNATPLRARHSLGFQAIDSCAADLARNHNASTATLLSANFDPDTWRSLQDLRGGDKSMLQHDYNSGDTTSSNTTCSRNLDATNSEPDLGPNRAVPANASPFRRAWNHSSFRTARTDKIEYSHLSPTVRRTASMTASDNDVYIKSMDGFIDELKYTCSQQHIAITGAAGRSEAVTNVMPGKLNNVGKTAVVPQIKIQTTKATLTATTNTASTAAAATKKPNEPCGVITWGSSFERLIEDPAGLQTFAEFLKKEFSAENIYFWTACERFRNTENDAERIALAKAIFSKHLANGSLEPVNVDSQARNLSEEKLQSGERDIFMPAQKQIFNLMKFDSYQRFIRSDLYKSCMDAETKRQPLPYAGDDLEELLKTNFSQGASSKLKKSASNAEDRHRKSLLPWHRKTRSKSRDRGDAGGDVNKFARTKLPQLMISSSLKIPSTTNSMSDVHSSRSSLSSFDALPLHNGQNNNNAVITAEVACSLCRVILSDGATTIVQTRQDETVGQLVERLLEKRGLTYQFYDVVANGSTKSIDLQSSAQQLAGKEVHIEQRVAFKLELPDPKVISVKSKPKKQLHEVIRPILQKYNYCMDAVRVVMRDTQAELDLSQPVTVADGHRLQIQLLSTQSLEDYQLGTVKLQKSSMPKSVSFPNVMKQLGNTNVATTTAAAAAATTSAMRNGGTHLQTQQSTLDEITNKVFTELMQGKVEAHANSNPLKTAGLQSDDCISEASSIFEQLRRRDTNIPALKIQKLKKKSTSSQHSDENPTTPTTPNVCNNNTAIINNQAAATAISSTNANAADVKKPIIAKLKAGVKLQVTERVAENQDDLLEGLKRAQLARLEDQRGTEINFELPDFLKNKENISAAASKLRKIRANLSPINPKSPILEEPTSTPTSPQIPTTPTERPQPAPRLSITNRNKTPSVSPMKIDEEPAMECLAGEAEFASDYKGGPPPLPPKPKVLPIKPSNWGASATNSAGGAKAATVAATTPTENVVPFTHSSKIPIEINRKSLLANEPATRCAYLDEPSSSFV